MKADLLNVAKQVTNGAVPMGSVIATSEIYQTFMDAGGPGYGIESPPARRPSEIALRLWDKGFYVRFGGDTLQLAPPFVATPEQIDSVVNAIGDALVEQP